MNDSNIFGVSVRGILAFIIVISCCGLAVWTKNMEVLKDLSLVAVSFYFGQKSQQSNIGGTNEKSINGSNNSVVIDTSTSPTPKP